MIAGFLLAFWVSSREKKRVINIKEKFDDFNKTIEELIQTLKNKENMEIDLNNVKFSREELDGLSEIIFNAFDKFENTDEELMEYWRILPNELKVDVIKYGITDTPTKDNIYSWLIDNFKR